MEEHPDRNQKDLIETLSEICSMDGTLYSYRNTYVAESAGLPIGALVGYNGALYAEMRRVTFAIVEQRHGLRLGDNPFETGVGEFYLDSMAIMPKYRGRGIGKMLINNMMQRAADLSVPVVSLLVATEKPRLRTYYESLGFSFFDKMRVFDANFDKLICQPRRRF